jgi:hypothetical protein
MKKYLATTKRLARVTGLTALAVSSLAVVGTTGVASADPGCGWATHTQEGIGTMSGAVLARHTFQSNYCWSDSDTSDGFNAVHTTEEVGYLEIPMSVTTTGENINKWGASYVSVGNASMEVCLAFGISGCGTANTYVQHTLDPSGVTTTGATPWYY